MSKKMRKEKIKSIYVELLEAIKKRTKRIKPEVLAIQTPVVGRKYVQRQDIRLLWVGRAVNSWNKYNVDDDNVAETLAQEQIDSYCGKTGFDWMKEKDKEEKKFNYKGSAFWRTCEKVLLSMAPDIRADEEEWNENIVWTNLYAAAPKDGGNPNSSLCKAQRAVCVRLLRNCFEDMEPSHVVFVTGWDWFEEFRGKDAEGFFSAVSVVEGSRYVVGQGRIGNAKILITVRPERKPEQEFANEIVKRFDLML